MFNGKIHDEELWEQHGGKKFPIVLVSKRNEHLKFVSEIGFTQHVPTELWVLLFEHEKVLKSQSLDEREADGWPVYEC